MTDDTRHHLLDATIQAARNAMRQGLHATVDRASVGRPRIRVFVCQGCGVASHVTCGGAPACECGTTSAAELLR